METPQSSWQRAACNQQQKRRGRRLNRRIFFSFCLLLTVLLITVSQIEAQQEDLWDPDRPEPTVVLKETRAVAQAIKKLPDKIKQVFHRKSTADQEEIDSNKIQRRGIDDPNVRNRLRSDIIPALEDSRHTRTLAFWTLVLAILTGLYAFVMLIMRRLISSYAQQQPLSRCPN